MVPEKAARIADDIIALYARHGGSEYAGEKVTQLEHMAQAAQLAQAEGCPEDVVLAAFLHDIGHIVEAETKENGMDGYGIKDHEEIGARFLRSNGFSERLAKLVVSHVAAKRYLTWRHPDYYDQLSEASKKTLVYQGGRMSEEEASAFEQDPLFEQIVRMRHWDEEAKIEHQPLPALEPFRNMIVRHLMNQHE